MAQAPRNPAALTVVCAVHFALGKLGLALGGFGGALATIWPSSGFAMAALVLFGLRMWPAVFAGAALAYLTATGLISSSLTFAIGHTLEAAIGASLVERFARGRHVFDDATTIFRFVVIAGAATTVSATFGAVAPSVIGRAPWTDFHYLWMSWWLASLTGILVVAPFTVLWMTSLASRVVWRDLIEAVAVLGLLAVASRLLFAPWLNLEIHRYPLQFLAAPFLLWMAFRLGPRGTATGVLVFSGVAVWGTARGWGPFAQEGRTEALVVVQAYTSVMAVTGLVLAAVVAGQRRAEDRLLALATTDSLTALANHRRLLEVLRAEVVRSNRTGRPFVVVFLDMDGLKALNDRHGHLAGSRALCRVADAIRSSCRAMDTPARYGGDEFAIVLPETNEAGGTIVLARVSARLADDTNGPLLSVSGGVAVFPRDGESPTLLLRAADQLLYQAKASRNRPAAG